MLDRAKIYLTDDIIREFEDFKVTCLRYLRDPIIFSDEIENKIKNTRIKSKEYLMNLTKGER